MSKTDHFKNLPKRSWFQVRQGPSHFDQRLCYYAGALIFSIAEKIDRLNATTLSKTLGLDSHRLRSILETLGEFENFRRLVLKKRKTRILNGNLGKSDK